MKYTYIHFIESRPRYVGQGSKRRPHDFYHRSPDWHRELDPRSEHICAVVTSCHKDSVAAELQEQGLISWLGQDELINKDSYHRQGRKYSDEEKEIYRQRVLNWDEETRARHKKACQNREFPDDMGKRVKEGQRRAGFTVSPQFFEAGRKASKGSKRTPEQRARMAEAARERWRRQKEEQ